MHIEWWTLVLQAINFLVLIWLLWRFLYRPVKEVIAKRKQVVDQAFADAEAVKGEAEAARQRFEDSRAALAQERQDMLKKIHEQLEAERREVLQQARQEADTLLEGANKSLAEAREAAVVEVREEAAALAVELASNLLRKTGATASNGAFLEHLESQLNAMTADERERLQGDLAADGARLTVVTSASLTPEEQKQWADRLNDCLGQGDKTEFATDPEILGGAELRFPHAVLKYTWADQLRKAQELLARDETAS